MKSVVAVCIFYVLIHDALSFSHFLSQNWDEEESIGVRQADSKYPDQFITQNVNHFDPTHNETFQQRYLVNDEYFDQKNKSVIFLMIFWEGAISEGWISSTVNTSWINLANQFGALAFYMEHRYWGKSLVTDNYTVENLRYFTVEQTLADIAYFIESVNNNYTFEHEPEWIVFGGSYAGSLCTWARYKYPHLIKGAVCSSAPVRTRLDGHEYYDTVAEAIKDVSQECHDVIGEGFAQLQELAQTASGREYIQNEALYLCENLTDHYETDNYQDSFTLLIDTLTNDFSAVAQLNKGNVIKFTEARRNYTLETLCSNFVTNETNANKSSLIRLGEYDKFWNGQQCLDFNRTSNLAYFQDTSNSERLWTWKVCFELGSQTTKGNGTAGNIFGTVPDLDYFIRTCRDTFSKEFDYARQKALTSRTALYYAGLNVNATATNVISVQGSYDPWHKMGVLESTNPGFTVIFMKGQAHVSEMYPARAIDPDVLVAARKQIRDIIASWLS